jgi:flagellin-like protein
MKRIWKNKDAVSPVIATILMVAITVVLAAVLYVMVIGFGGGTTSTPAGAWNSVAPESQTSGKLVFGAFTTDVAPLDIKIFVTHNGSAAGSISFSPNVNPAASWTGGTPAVMGTAVIFDYSPTGGEVNAGDYITLTGLDPNTAYTFEVFHNPTDATVTMTGANGQFTTPA